MRANHLRFLALGGVGQIGKNMFVLEVADRLLVIDSGLMFPEEEMLGVDLVIPDLSYLEENRDRVEGIILTHGHEDHVGALPYVLPRLAVPVWGTRLTLGLVREKLEEFHLEEQADLREIDPDGEVVLGPFRITFFRVCHSVPDGVGLAIHTPAGLVIHSSDFKFDPSPIDGRLTDFARLADLGGQGPILLLTDCTNVERPGYTPSERLVGEKLDELFKTAEQRVIVATFASNIHRVQQVFDVSRRHGRRVAIVGRSLEGTSAVASRLGYLKVPDDTWVSPAELEALPRSQATVVTTGSQGEPLSALTRMAMGEHKQVRIEPGDTVVISARPIPGNEDLVFRVVNHLFRRGAKVIYEESAGVHVSGHGRQEELKLLLNLLRPRYVVPVHGEYRHQVRYVELAASVGLPPERVFLLDIGEVLEIGPEGAAIDGRVNAGSVMIDGLGVGDIGSVVLRDRKHLAEDGIIIVVLTIDGRQGEILAGPDILTRGFSYGRYSEALIEEAKQVVRETMQGLDREEATEWTTVKAQVRRELNQFIYERVRRRPVVLPVVTVV